MDSPGPQSYLGGIITIHLTLMGPHGPLFSNARIHRYLVKCGNDPAKALDLYTWNLRISTAMWTPISVLEVAMRNAMHTQLCAYTGQSDWWNHLANYLCPRDYQSFAITTTTRADAKVHKSHCRNSVHGALPANQCSEHHTSVDDIIADTNFSDWNYLLGLGGSSASRRDPLHDYPTRLWEPALKKAFAHPTLTPSARAGGATRPTVLKRKTVYDLASGIRIVRNRIAHHEQILTSGVPTIHGNLLALAESVHPDLRSYIEDNSQVPRIISEYQSVLDFDGSWNSAF